jgi:hypothetical protein
MQAGRWLRWLANFGPRRERARSVCEGSPFRFMPPGSRLRSARGRPPPLSCRRPSRARSSAVREPLSLPPPKPRTEEQTSADQMRFPGARIAELVQAVTCIRRSIGVNHSVQAGLADISHPGPLLHPRKHSLLPFRSALVELEPRWAHTTQSVFTQRSPDRDGHALSIIFCHLGRASVNREREEERRE